MEPEHGIAWLASLVTSDCVCTQGMRGTRRCIQGVRGTHFSSVSKTPALLTRTLI